MTANSPASPKIKAKAPPQTNDTDVLDTRLVAQLAHLLQDSDLSEIEVAKGDLRIRLSRHISGGVPSVAVASPTAAATVPHIVVSTEPVPPSANTVPAPMVGTAFRGASPGAKAFVEVGSRVATGDRIMLIEAMKTFNDILSPRSGIVSAILINDGQPVEYGQPLMVID